MPGINLQGIKASGEVSQSVGTRGLENEAKDYSSALNAISSGVSTLGGVISKKKSAADKAEGLAIAGNLQVELLGQQTSAAQSEIETELNDPETLAALNGAMALRDKFKLAQSRGVGDAFLRLQQATALTSAIRSRPDLVKEFNNIFSSSSAIADKLDAEIGDFRGAQESAAAKQIENAGTRLVTSGLVSPEMLRTMSTSEIQQAHVSTGLAQIEALTVTTSMEADLAEKNLTLNETNKKIWRTKFNRDKGPTLSAAMAVGAKQVLGLIGSQPGITADNAQIIVADARNAMIDQMISMGLGDSPKEIQDNYGSQLKIFDVLDGIDPASDQASHIESLMNLTIKSATMNALDGNENLLEIRSYADAMGPAAMRSPQAGSHLGTLVERVSLDNLNGRQTIVSPTELQSAIEDNKTGFIQDVKAWFGGSVKANTPEGTAAKWGAYLEGLNQNFPNSFDSDIISSVIGPIGQPKNAEAWASYRQASPQNRYQMERFESKLAAFVERNTKRIQSHPNAGSVKWNPETMALESDSRDRQFAAQLGNVNATVKALATLRGIASPTAAQLIAIMEEID